MSEVLARLNAGHIDINHIPGGFQALTSSDIAYALSGLNELHKRYAMHSYVYTPEIYQIDVTTHADLILLHHLLIKKLVHELHIKAAKAEKLSIIHMVTIRDGFVCTTCRGQKEYRDQSGHKHKCYVCDASGYMTRTDSELSRMIDVHKQNWARDYEKHFIESCKIVTEIKQRIARHVRSRLK